jgi:hypothetical protein
MLYNNTEDLKLLFHYIGKNISSKTKKDIEENMDMCEPILAEDEEFYGPKVYELNKLGFKELLQNQRPVSDAIGRKTSESWIYMIKYKVKIPQR